jgi:uncharacterized protein (TIGR00255 family)
MVKSMTGFGRAELKSKYGKFSLEIKSLNHRYFELSCRFPNHLSSLEDRLKEVLAKRIKRGRINLTLSYEKTPQAEQLLELDEQLAKRYLQLLARLKKKLRLEGELRLEQFLTLPGLIAYEPIKENTEALWPTIQQLTAAALQRLLVTREKEGRRLGLDLLLRTKKIALLAKKIERQIPKVISSYRHKLNQRIEEILCRKEVSRMRLEEEIALFAKNCDISEELTRIKSHLRNFQEVLAKEETGRQLDFIVQELQRETNTLSAKAQDYTISRWAIDIKSELEKMREQIQNIE